jgi:transcriptional regulator with XRE-family HTH domain
MPRSKPADAEPSAETVEPFRIALARLLNEREMSQRELERLTKKRGAEGLSQTAISFLLNGSMEATGETMRIIARALDLEPEYFAEYRLWKFRGQFDPSTVGLDRALANLRDLGPK